MRVLVFVFCLAAVPAVAAPSFEDAAQAMEKCERTWFQGTRERSLKTIEAAGFTIASQLNPLSAAYEENKANLERVSEWLRRCTQITYPPEG